jgi:hypothetical protein
MLRPVTIGQNRVGLNEWTQGLRRNEANGLGVIADSFFGWVDRTTSRSHYYTTSLEN